MIIKFIRVRHEERQGISEESTDKTIEAAHNTASH